VSSASCAYVTENTLIVKATGSFWDSLQSGLAQNGDYWAPFTGTVSVAPYCTLSSGDSTITVYPTPRPPPGFV
jgi:hypothetical protein